MQQVENLEHNKKTPRFGRLLICNNYMVPLTHFVSNTLGWLNGLIECDATELAVKGSS